MENPGDYFDGWIKLQQQAFSALREQTEQMQNAFKNASSYSADPYSGWSKAAFQSFTEGNDATMAKDTFSKTLYGTEAMQKLYAFWLPLVSAMKDKAVDPSSYAKLVDAEKVKEFFNTLFNFQPEVLSQLQQQSTLYTDLYQQYGKSWSDAAQSGAAQVLNSDPAVALSPQALFRQMQAAYAMLDSAAGKIINIPALGKDREAMELLSKCAKSMSAFVSRHLEYQQMMQDTGSEAMQATTKAIAKKVKAGEKFDTFDDFFALWIDTSEKTFNKLFRSKTFSQKRNAMTDAGFKTRKLYNQIIENQLADLPIARRSEMDEVYKMIYDLRKKVKALEDQLHDAGKSN